MSLYNKCNISVGDRVILNDNYSFPNVYKIINVGEVFYIKGIRENGTILECESSKEFEHHSSNNFGIGKKKVILDFHITSNMSTWFDIPKREESLKILLNED